LEFFVAQRASTVRISEEHANVCRALEFAIHNHEGITAAKIVDALGYPWYAVGQPDGRLWCERVLAVVPADAPAVTRAGALVSAGVMRQEALQYDAALTLLREARELYRSANNVLGEAWALIFLGRDAMYRAPASPEARTLFEEALFHYRQSDFPAGAGWALAFLATIALHADDEELARRRAEEAVQLGTATHIDQVVAMGLRILADLDCRASAFESADRRLSELIAIYEAAGDRGQLLGAHALAAELIASRGDITRATSHLAAGAELAGDMQAAAGAVEWLAPLIASAAYVAYMDDRADDAAVLFGARLSLDPLTFPKRLRGILGVLEKQGLRKEFAAGANLDTDETLKRVGEFTAPPPASVG
jgi:hypothetical protein